MRYWIYKGTRNGMEVFRCNGCGFEKCIMHAASGRRRPKKDGSPTVFHCPMCKEEINYR